MGGNARENGVVEIREKRNVFTESEAKPKRRGHSFFSRLRVLEVQTMEGRELPRQLRLVPVRDPQLRDPRTGTRSGTPIHPWTTVQQKRSRAPPLL